MLGIVGFFAKIIILVGFRVAPKGQCLFVGIVVATKRQLLKEQILFAIGHHFLFFQLNVTTQNPMESNKEIIVNTI